MGNCKEKQDEKEVEQKEEIEHLNVEDSIKEYFSNKIAENKEPLSINEVLGKFKGHVKANEKEKQKEKENEGDREL